VPLFDLFWSILIVFLWVAWIWVVVGVVTDIFRSDVSGVSKALWVLFVILLPWLGVLMYIIVNGDAMTQRNMESARRQDEAAQAYIRQAAGTSTSTAEELEKLSSLKDRGVISDAEFASQKAKLLA
jgi:hypothetical protein